MLKSFITEDTVQDLCRALQRSAAMCDLLHAHARGETDLTEDQLASVVTDVSGEARRALTGLMGRTPEAYGLLLSGSGARH